jgi:hypothetical protein
MQTLQTIEHQFKTTLLADKKNTDKNRQPHPCKYTPMTIKPSTKEILF